MKPIPSSARKMFSFTLLILFATCVLSEPSRVSAADQTQWGQRHSRNMVSPEKGLPSEFDPETGRNIKWSVSLGRRAYVGPSIGSGKVLVGADNSTPRDPRHEGDLAVLICLDEATGEMLWQLAVPRITGDIYLDWPRCGLCSIPTIEGDRAYVVTNRYEVICLDMRGMADGNDGIYQDEAEHMMPEGETPVPLSPKDADILWLFDMRTEVGMYPHDSAHTSILLDGDLLYLNTCNGVDNTHKRIRAPEAPSLIVLNKNTGELFIRLGPLQRWERSRGKSVSSSAEGTAYATHSRPSTQRRSRGKRSSIFTGYGATMATRMLRRRMCTSIFVIVEKAPAM
jgi:hypothetical protein